MNLEVEAIVLSKQCDIRTVQDPNQLRGGVRSLLKSKD